MPTIRRQGAKRTDEVKDYGLILKPAEQDHWQLGGEEPEILPSGDWSPYKNADEAQSIPFVFDTMACAVFGTLKAWAMLSRFHGFDDFPKDLSERYSGVMCGVTPSGSDPHEDAEIIRKKAGAIPAASMPWTPDITTWNEYYDRQMAYWNLPLGQALLDRFELGHEWVFPFGSSYSPAEKAQLIKDAMKRGTVCVSVRAWHKKGRYYTKRDSEKDTHWVNALRFEGENLVIHDQYDPFEKTLTPEYNHEAAKVYFLKRKVQTDRGFWSMILDGFAKLARSLTTRA